jgi:hypothetical protein
MANAKISALPLAITPLAGTEVLPIVQSGVTDQISVANLTAGRAVSTGNLTVTGTAAVSGLTTLTGGMVGGIQALSGPGAVNVTTLTTAFTSTGTGDALTLANGTAGQIKTIAYVAEAAGGDTGVLTPTTALGFTSITFNAVGDTATLQYTSLGWVILAVRGASVT